MLVFTGDCCDSFADLQGYCLKHYFLVLYLIDLAVLGCDAGCSLAT